MNIKEFINEEFKRTRIIDEKYESYNHVPTKEEYENLTREQKDYLNYSINSDIQEMKETMEEMEDTNNYYYKDAYEILKKLYNKKRIIDEYEISINNSDMDIVNQER